jgi:hypothetical protein
MGLESVELAATCPPSAEDLFDFALIEAIKPLYTAGELTRSTPSINRWTCS